MECINVGDTSAHFKDRDFCLRPQNSIKQCAEYFRILGHQVHLSHVTDRYIEMCQYNLGLDGHMT